MIDSNISKYELPKAPPSGRTADLHLSQVYTILCVHEQHTFASIAHLALEALDDCDKQDCIKSSIKDSRSWLRKTARIL